MLTLAVGRRTRSLQVLPQTVTLCWRQRQPQICCSQSTRPQLCRSSCGSALAAKPRARRHSLVWQLAALWTVTVKTSTTWRSACSPIGRCGTEFSFEGLPWLADRMRWEFADSSAGCFVGCHERQQMASTGPPSARRRVTCSSSVAAGDAWMKLCSLWLSALQARRAEMVSTLTSLRDFRARVPAVGDGAASGSDPESSDFDSTYDTEEESDEDPESSTDEDEPPTSTAAPLPNDSAAVAMAPPETNGHQLTPGRCTGKDGRVQAATPAAAATPTSNGTTASDVPQPAAPVPKAHGASHDSVRTTAGGAMPAQAPAAAKTTVRGAAASTASQANGCAVVAAHLPLVNGSRQRPSARPPLQRMAPSTDFQALSSVLRQFLAAVEASPVMQLPEGGRQTARLSMVHGEDSSLMAHTGTGSSIKLSWHFPAEPPR